MHTPSTRILSALAYDRGEEYDPADPVWLGVVQTLSLVEHAAPVIGDDGPYERARQRDRERTAIPDLPAVGAGADADEARASDSRA